MKTLLLWLSVLYILWVVGSFIFIAITPSFSDVGHLKDGCYIVNALISAVECNGFTGDGLLGLLVNIPFIVFQLILPIGKVMVILLFISPALYVPWYLYKHNN